MKTLIKTLLVTAVIATATISVPAGAYKVFGHGNTSCGKWISEKSENSWLYRTYDAWVLGFVSGNSWAENHKYEAHSDRIFGWIDNYCQANPMKYIHDAVEALVIELEK